MSRSWLSAVAVFCVLGCLFFPAVLPAGELTLKPREVRSSGSYYEAAAPPEWDLVDEDGGLAGTLHKTEEGNYQFYDEQGDYGGIILSGGMEWIPKTGKYPRVTPEAARLYLDIVDAIERASR